MVTVQRHTSAWTRIGLAGAVAGIVAGLVMAVYAMIASAGYTRGDNTNSVSRAAWL